MIDEQTANNYEIVPGMSLASYICEVKKNPDKLKKWGMLHEKRKAPTAGACPECGDNLTRQGGCVQCLNPTCGYSECG